MSYVTCQQQTAALAAAKAELEAKLPAFKDCEGDALPLTASVPTCAQMTSTATTIAQAEALAVLAAMPDVFQ